MRPALRPASKRPQRNNARARDGSGECTRALRPALRPTSKRPRRNNASARDGRKDCARAGGGFVLERSRRVDVQVSFQPKPLQTFSHVCYDGQRSNENRHRSGYAFHERPHRHPLFFCTPTPGYLVTSQTVQSVRQLRYPDVGAFQRERGREKERERERDRQTKTSRGKSVAWEQTSVAALAPPGCKANLQTECSMSSAAVARRG